MFQCQVLRCQNAATRTFLVDDRRWGLFETMVCGPHSAALRAGERYRYNSAENVLYMGADAADDE